MSPNEAVRNYYFRQYTLINSQSAKLIRGTYFTMIILISCGLPWIRKETMQHPTFRIRKELMGNAVSFGPSECAYYLTIIRRRRS